MEVVARLMALKARTKAIDPKTGELLRLYHGTSTPFERFSLEGRDPHKRWGPGVYLTEDPKIADWYADWHGDFNDNPVASQFMPKAAARKTQQQMIRPHVLDVQNPLDLDTEAPEAIMDMLERYSGRGTRRDAEAMLGRYQDMPRVLQEMQIDQRVGAARSGLGYRPLADLLREAGHDALVGTTAISGARGRGITGKPGREWMVLDPNRVLNPYTGLPIALLAALGASQGDD